MWKHFSPGDRFWKCPAVTDEINRANTLSVHSSHLIPPVLSLILRLLHCLSLSSLSNRQPCPASSASPRGHGCVWGALSPSSSPACGLWGRGGRSGSLQRPLRWRRPPVGPQGLSRERLVAVFFSCSYHRPVMLNLLLFKRGLSTGFNV